VLGQTFPELHDTLELLPGVEQVIPISKPYKLASREFHPQDTIVKVKDIAIGGNEIVIMAGPCAVENEEQLLTTAQAVKAAGANVLRGGAFKPRTSPYQFRGLGERGLKMLANAGKETGMPTITEVMTPNDIELVAEYADILQIGARNMQNFILLDEVGKFKKPVMLKRGLSSTIQEWLLAAEYILAQGNEQLILCERGIRTFETYTRNTMDVSAIPVIKKVSHLPIIADPSHATGKWYLVAPLALAAVAAGANGLIIEVHPNPDQALADGPQSLTFDNFRRLMSQLTPIAQAMNKKLAVYGAKAGINPATT
jgi:3-deoxy-7-phosphoheptulonate synthase